MKQLKSYRSVKLTLVRESSPPYPPKVECGVDVAKFVKGLVDDDPRECFIAIYLDAKHRIIAAHLASIGSIETAPFDPRVVFGPALTLMATSMVIAHNHPSGECKPSAEDVLVTERLRKCSDLLGLRLLDHVVIGTDSFYSFADESTHRF